jgi:hypothetical protein
MKFYKYILLLWVCGIAHAQVYNQFECGGDINGAGCTWNNQVISPAAVTLAKQANLAASTVQGNATLSAAAPQALNPLSVANLMSASIGALSAISLAPATPAFGTYTNDAVVLNVGNIVLVFAQAGGQTCGTGTNSGGTGGAISGAGFCEGLWVVQAAAWTRPANFPSGYVIPANCNLIVMIAQGTTKQGHNYYRANIASPTTIDASNPNFLDKTLGPATTTSFGTVEVTSTTLAASVSIAPALFNDCVSFGDTVGSVADNGNSIGNQGPCVTADANGHPLLPAAGSAPTVNHGAIAAGGSDNRGQITGITAQTSVTLTFNTAMPAGIGCVATESAAVPVALSITAISTSSVTFTAAAAFTGTIYYLCF